MVEVVGYHPDYAEAFADLNKQWIEKFFAIEAEDLKVLENPQGYVLDGGGEIFFAVVHGQAVGTVAMIKTADAVYELAKMAVAPACQGQGISRLLMSACLKFARHNQAREVFLVTNDILAPAMGLYQKSGFVRLPQISDQRYARGNTQMVLAL